MTTTDQDTRQWRRPDLTPASDGIRLLSTLTGSRAYGTARPGSDVDTVTVTTWTFTQLAGIQPPLDRTTHRVGATEDDVHTDVAAFLQGVVSGRARDVEVMFASPDTLRGPVTPPAQTVLDHRDLLVTGPAVRAGYGGYMRGLAHRLAGSSGRDSVAADGRAVEKAARTLHRLAVHVEQLWETGHLTLALADPDANVAFGRQVATSGDLGPVRALVAATGDLFERPTPLEQDEATARDVADGLCVQARRWASAQDV